MPAEENQAVAEETANNEAEVQETTEASAEEQVAEAATEAEPTEEESNPAAELEAAQAKVKEYWDQILRLQAEIQNNQKRAQRDIQNAHNFSLKGFAEALLPIIDSMEMGMDASTAENANLDSIREGMEMTMNMFTQVLEKHGLYQVNPVGEKFNPEEHQAMSMIEDPEHESNTVINVMQKGYLLNGRLVRPAMVVVSK